MSTYTIVQIAALLQRQPRTVRARWRLLHERHGFPRPLPGLGLVWSQVQVDGWIAGGAAWRITAANDHTPKQDCEQARHRLRSIIKGSP